MWYIDTREYYAAAGKDKIIQISVIRIKLEDIMLNIAHLKKKYKHCVILIHVACRITGQGNARYPRGDT